MNERAMNVAIASCAWRRDRRCRPGWRVPARLIQLKPLLVGQDDPALYVGLVVQDGAAEPTVESGGDDAPWVRSMGVDGDAGRTVPFALIVDVR